MPLHRRLPKRGFTSLTHKFVEVIRLSDLESFPLMKSIWPLCARPVSPMV